MDGWFEEAWAGSGSKGWRSKGNKGLSPLEPKEQRKLVTLTQGWPPWILKCWVGYSFFPRGSAEAEREQDRTPPRLPSPPFWLSKGS